MSRSLLLVALALVLCTVSVEAHVRLLFTGTPIRNAPSPKLDGAYSVSGPCGGVATYGAQGVTTVTEGSVMSLKIGYNGGHQDANNAFHAAFVCGTYTVGAAFPDEAKLKLATQPATTTSPGLLVLTDGSALVPAADSSTAGYTLNFKAPILPAGATGRDCVISLLDQRQWGGCVDIKLVAGGTGQAGGSSTTLGVTKSQCGNYCEGMSQVCAGAYTDNNACMTTCGNFTQVNPQPGDGVYSGDNLQCRQHHLEYAAMYPNAAPAHCGHASAISANASCVDMDGVSRVPSPCFTYCNAVFANCPMSNYYANKPACMAKCAALLTTGLGSDSTPPKGNNLQCRTTAAQFGMCADANPVATGECSVANPLKLKDDTISAIYNTQPGVCDTVASAAANTISGCCCLSGSITVIHVKGSTIATVSTNLNTTFGQMCGSGNMTIPNGADPNAAPGKYTFATPVTVAPANFQLQQKDPASTDLAGSFTIAGEPFDFQLVDGLLVITNDVPSTQKPRVCSINAKYASKIDSSNMPLPIPDGTGGVAPLLGAASALQFNIVALFLAAVVAIVAAAY